MARTTLSLYQVCCGLDFARRLWDEKVQWVFLFVCLSRFRAAEFLGLNLRSTLFLRRLVAPPRNVEFENAVKFVFFCPSRATQ